MLNKIGHVTLLVRDYDQAVSFYVERVGFELKSDYVSGKDDRWVTVGPQGTDCTGIVFIKANTLQKVERTGTQSAEHVFFTIHTDDCMADFEEMKSRGVKFKREPRQHFYGTEALFEDLYGNRISLIELAKEEVS